MSRSAARRLAATLTTAALLGALPMSTAAAKPSAPLPVPDLPATVLEAGSPEQVCDFDLQVEGTGASWDKVVTRGNTTVSRGTGYRLTFTNLDEPGRAVTFEPTRQKLTVVDHGNGTTTETTKGSSGILLFPGDKSLDSDQDDGPSGMLHFGTTVFYNTPGVDILVEVKAKKSIDICDVLS